MLLAFLMSYIYFLSCTPEINALNCNNYLPIMIDARPYTFSKSHMQSKLAEVEIEEPKKLFYELRNCRIEDPIGVYILILSALLYIYLTEILPSISQIFPVRVQCDS